MIVFKKQSYFSFVRNKWRENISPFFCKQNENFTNRRVKETTNNKTRSFTYARIDNYQLSWQSEGNICTSLPILKKNVKKEKRKKNAYKSYVCEHEGVIPFIKNSNVYIVV